MFEIYINIVDLNSYFRASCKSMFILPWKKIIDIKTSVLNVKRHWNVSVDKCPTINDFGLGNKYHCLMHGYLTLMNKI